MNVKYLNTYYSQEYVYQEIKKYFSIEEFFSKRMCNKYREDQLWSFLDFRMLSNLLFIRVKRGNKITINNWKFGGTFTQRGFRSMFSKIVVSYYLRGILYASAHGRAGAVDFNEKGIVSEETRNWIINNSLHLPFKCRLEWKKKGKIINWVHMDSDFYPDHPKVYRFNV